MEPFLRPYGNPIETCRTVTVAKEDWYLLALRLSSFRAFSVVVFRALGGLGWKHQAFEFRV